MKNENPTMEEGIITEDNQEEPAVISEEKTNHKLAITTNNAAFKKGVKSLNLLKLKIIFFLVIAFSLILTGLIFLSTRNGPEQEEILDITVTSPTEAPKPQDIEKTALEILIGSYVKKIDNLSTTIGNFPPPKVDLDLKF